MTEPMKQRWEDVGQRFEALGRVLKERYQSAERAPDTAHAAEQDEASEERGCASRGVRQDRRGRPGAG